MLRLCAPEAVTMLARDLRNGARLNRTVHQAPRVAETGPGNVRSRSAGFAALVGVRPGARGRGPVRTAVLDDSCGPLIRLVEMTGAAEGVASRAAGEMAAAVEADASGVRVGRMPTVPEAARRSKRHRRLQAR